VKSTDLSVIHYWWVWLQRWLHFIECWKEQVPWNHEKAIASDFSPAYCPELFSLVSVTSVSFVPSFSRPWKRISWQGNQLRESSWHTWSCNWPIFWSHTWRVRVGCCCTICFASGL